MSDHTSKKQLRARLSKLQAAAADANEPTVATAVVEGAIDVDDDQIMTESGNDKDDNTPKYKTAQITWMEEDDEVEEHWCISGISGQDVDLHWSSQKDLLECVQNNCEAWMDALEGLNNRLRNTENELKRNKRDLAREVAKDACNKEMLKSLNAKIVSLNDENVIAKNDTDAILQSAESLATANESWKKKWAEVEKEKQILEQEVKNLRVKLRLLSMNEGEEDPASRTRPESPSNHMDNELVDNPRFPDAPLFDGDREKYPGWKIKVIQKLRNSRKQYPTDRSRIDYITTRCIEDAEDPVVERADMGGDNPYITTEEVWEDLDNAFGDSDKVATAEMKLASAEFPMKNSETFDHFLTRFTSTINKIPYMSVEAKIRSLRDNITKRLQAKITGTRTTNLKEITDEIRRHDIELRRINDKGDLAETKKDSRKRKDQSSKNTGSSEKRQRTDLPEGGYKGKDNTKRTQELKDKLIKAKACWRCGKIGHRSSDSDAPCQGKPAITNEELKLLLNAISENTESLS